MTQRFEPTRWATPVVVIVALLIGLGFWQATRGSWGPGSSSGQGSVPVGLKIFDPGERPSLPVLEGLTIENEPLSLRDFTGQVLVLNVWGSWCGPCRAEAPLLARVSRKTRQDGVRFVGIDTRDNPSAARSFERRYGITYPSFDDQDGQVLGRLSGIVPLSVVPSTVFVDRDGSVASRVIGQIDAGTLRGVIEDLTAGADRSPGGKG